MAEEFEERRLTAEEVQAMIALWSQRRDLTSAGPTVADVAEALEISLAEAEILAGEVRTGPSAHMPPPPYPNKASEWERGAVRRREQTVRGVFAGRLTLASLALTGFFCAYLDKVLA